ncbi:MAG: MBL fold metallo-hydrolase [Asgard group archaeon]|nr:MBL fold metallo-hydrolase [Asgard group archaeon]
MLEILDVTKNIAVTNPSNLCGNITCINTDEGLIFIDAGLLAREVEKFKLEMEKKFEKETIYLILTHNHNDHIFGMKPFQEVPIISTDKCKKIIEDRLETDFTTEGLKEISKQFLQNMDFFRYMGIQEQEVNEIAKFSDVEIRAPTTGFAKELILSKGKKMIIATNSGGHSLDSATIYIPSEEVLITGDEFYHSLVPLLGGLPESHENWLNALKNWENLTIKKVIPGHGIPVDFDYVSKARLFVEKMFEALYELKEKNTKDDDILKDERLMNFYGKSNWKDDEWWKMNIKALYQKIKDE